MAGLQTGSFDHPDETRAPDKTKVEVVDLGSAKAARLTVQPGWKWSECIKPVVGTDSCQARHVGVVVAGQMHIVHDDGTEADVGAGDAYVIEPGHDAWVVGDEPWVTLEWTSAREFGVSPEGPGERILATVLFTDIVDSTGILQRVGDAAWRDTLAAHNRLLREDLNAFRGREVATTGDGFLAIFDGATRAVRCGLAMTRSARRAGLEIRVGLHTGEVEMEGSNARGVAVHTAARVMSLAAASEVLVSWTTRDLLEGSGLTLEDAGSHELKGLAGERRLFRLVPPARD